MFMHLLEKDINLEQENNSGGYALTSSLHSILVLYTSYKPIKPSLFPHIKCPWSHHALNCVGWPKPAAPLLQIRSVFMFITIQKMADQLIFFSLINIVNEIVIKIIWYSEFYPSNPEFCGFNKYSLRHKQVLQPQSPCFIGWAEFPTHFYLGWI